jgi:Cu2+-exporting ATPase
MRLVDVVVFDKTGTLTKGSHRVVDVASVDGDTGALLRVAAAAETESEHPLARAVIAAASDEGGLPEASEFASMSGRGVRARVEGRTISVGGPRLLEESGVSVPEGIRNRADVWEDRGAAVLYVIDDDGVLGAISLEDEIREESRAAIDRLHQVGVRVAMITGDATQVAEAVAADLDIDEVRAQILPEDKHAAIADLQAQGHSVAMVGDGVNDAPALAQADVGIAIGAGTDVAIESAGIVLASDDPRAVVAIRDLSTAGYRKMIQNLWWAAGYNLVSLPAAAGAFLWAGFVLGPAVGAVLMSASTVIVAANAQLLRRVDLGQA